ncbi:MAG: muramidase [Mesorhizobium sp.]|nr:MAG: muramidase [Mesorhizobium sp.]
MRLSGVVIFSIAALCLAGCTSTSGVDALQVPSSETTNSVVRPPAPVASVGAADAAPAFAQEEAMDQAVAMAPPEPVESIEPPAEPIALVAPKRLARAAPILAEPVQRYRFRDAKPINFGRASPRHLAVHGVDVSRWQGNVNWDKLRAQGANFAYIKGALPPVIDVEWNGESSCKRRPSRQKVLEKMQVFMDKLERHYGQRPIIYTAPDFYRDNLRGAFLDYPFWLRAVAQHPSKVYPGRKWVFWQYSGSGLSHGVRGRIDLNVFHGDERAWRNWVGGRQMVAEAE